MAKTSKHASIIKTFNAVPLDDQPQLLLDMANQFDLARMKRTRALSEELLRLAKGAKLIEPAVKYASKANKAERVKPSAKYRSKEDRRLTWSGRGSLPRWMREEMKELKLKPEAFLIAKRK